MAVYRWVLQGAEGQELRRSEAFSTREDAEAWMGREWSELRDEGGRFVVLLQDAETLYRMSLDDG